MSHQTGIKASDELHDAFNESRKKENRIRLIKVIIEEEKLECAAKEKMISDEWEADYDSLVLPLLQPKNPCYIIYRMQDEKSWILICYTPDDAHVRQKMLYAATKSTLKQEFGDGLLVNEISGTEKSDVNLQGYHAHVSHNNAPPPLTGNEQELRLVKENEAKTNVGVTTRHKTVQGLQFPLDENLLNAIDQFSNGQINYFQMVIDISNEVINLSYSGDICANDLSSQISDETPQYHVFRFDHTFEGDQMSSNFFLYTMPGYKVPIKSRMLFSSCKGALMSSLEQDFGIKLEKSLEMDSSEKPSETSLFEEIHPPQVETKKAFNKPKAPGRRGPSRRPPRENNH